MPDCQWVRNLAYIVPIMQFNGTDELVQAHKIE